MMFGSTSRQVTDFGAAFGQAAGTSQGGWVVVVVAT